MTTVTAFIGVVAIVATLMALVPKDWRDAVAIILLSAYITSVVKDKLEKPTPKPPTTSGVTWQT